MGVKRSLIYRSGALYEIIMRVLYGRYYANRYRALNMVIPAGSSVTELCCGPGTLFRKYLRDRNIHYTGLDMNNGFVAKVIQAGGYGICTEITSKTPIPHADRVIMQASLYHFLPDEAEPVLLAMLAAAREEILVAEPVKNLATASHPVLAFFGKHLTDPGSGKHTYRFNAESLEALIMRVTPSECVIRQLVGGGREVFYRIRST